MSEARRTVRTSPWFFDDLDDQLDHHRGNEGEPSAGDFQTYELIAIVERFATGFDELPEFIPGRPDYRVLIATGTLFAAFMVIGQLMADGDIELLQLEIDLEPPPPIE